MDSNTCSSGRCRRNNGKSNSLECRSNKGVVRARMRKALSFAIIAVVVAVLVVVMVMVISEVATEVVVV